ncbi:hypothetical protein DM02DRAFT_220113 [Periconia macrospinosa]|uniref:Uncharacterized protein n=1 Tax=Periconia macrospinosa TaxID=97972 RepID=A0A2V1E0A4_9PLEO|nr:hypothetical protein DM02DRAFT_220113 [Periconia macrospinosa]
MVTCNGGPRAAVIGPFWVGRAGALSSSTVGGGGWVRARSGERGGLHGGWGVHRWGRGLLLDVRGSTGGRRRREGMRRRGSMQCGLAQVGGRRRGTVRWLQRGRGCARGALGPGWNNFERLVGAWPR